jgi:transposase-like protein
MTTHEGERLRRELRRRGGARGRRFDPELRQRIVAFAEQRRLDGASWAAIATELGACFETVRRWCGGGSIPATRQLRRVEVVPEPVVEVGARPAMAVVAPNGIRIEGVRIDDVVSLVRALG